MIELIEGSSTDTKVINKIITFAKKYSKAIVVLDSNHTTEYVLSELTHYSRLVTQGNYCVVFDTLVGDLPKNLYNDRPWGPKKNPRIAVQKIFKD